jgi:radical SAM protein with 4Fe4S-binding SPASM domain
MWNYLGTRLCSVLKPERVPFLPVHLDIEPNNTCNFRCPHCQVTHWNKERAYLDTDRFKDILDQFPGFLRIKLQGMGEPLLNGSLAELLGEGEARRAEMSIISNGSIYTDEIAEKLMTLRRTLITFSLDGATAPVFEKIREGSSFERVTENIGRYVRARGGAPSPILAAWTIVTRDNVEELPGIVTLTASLGLDHLTIQTFLSDWGKDEMQDHTDPVRVELESKGLRESLGEATARARRAGLRMKIVSHDYYSSKRPCRWPWTSAYIAANGDVVPCCIIADSDTACMGNLFERDFGSIWNGGAYRELRRRIRDNDLPEYCKSCYLSP